MKQTQVKHRVSQKAIHKAAKASSALEGVDFEEAIKDQKVIDILKKHGRAFSV